MASNDKSSGDKGKSSGGLSSLSLIVSILVGLLAILGFFGIRSFEDLTGRPSTAAPTATIEAGFVPTDTPEPTDAIWAEQTPTASLFEFESSLTRIAQLLESTVIPLPSATSPLPPLIIDTPTPDVPYSQDPLEILSVLRANGREIRQVAFTPNSEWIILYDRNEARWHAYLPRDLADKIIELNKSGVELRDVAFSPNSGWVVLYGRNDAAWNGIPQEMSDKINEYHSQGVELKDIAFSPNSGWVILYDKNGAWWSGIPQDAIDKITELNQQGVELKQMAFSPGGGWIILYNQNEASWNGIPSSTSDKLIELNANGELTRHIAFTPKNGWVIVWGSNNYASEGIP
jgi:hypothetical protein